MDTASNQSDKASAISQARPAADRYLQILREELPETYEHSIRVMEYCMLYTAYSGMPRDEAMELTTAAMLHDIGKLDVPKSIIEKPGRLTHDEFEEVKRHPIVGYEIARSIGMPDDVCDAILLHHRNVDDSGYPSTHKHANIYARIIHIIDVYDAMTSPRCYKPGMPVANVFDFIDSHLDTMFDAELARTWMGCRSQETALASMQSSQSINAEGYTSC